MQQTILYFWFGLLKKYTKENLTQLYLRIFSRWFRFGTLSVQRRNYKQGTLDEKRSNLLGNLDGWIWDTNTSF